MTQEPLDLNTGRLLIREMNAADAPRLAALGGVPEGARMMLSLTAPWPVAAAQAWIEAAPYRQRPGFRAGIALPGTGLIGAIGLYNETPPTLAYFIAPEWAGQGYVSEAARAVLAHAFTALGVREVAADHFTDNPASGRILRKLGFIETGEAMGESAARLEPARLTLYRLTRTDFEATTCNS